MLVITGYYGDTESQTLNSSVLVWFILSILQEHIK